MTPITAYFTLLVFGLLAIGFRNQFIAIYPPAHDSGGKLWLNFQWTSVICMIIAEGILLALLLIKEAYPAAILMLPLVITTVLFHLYRSRRHFIVARYLPMVNCATIDRINEHDGMTFESFKDQYLQPSLKEKVQHSEIGSTSKQSAHTRSDAVVEDEARQSDYHGSESSDHSPHKKKHKKHKIKRGTKPQSRGREESEEKTEQKG